MHQSVRLYNVFRENDGKENCAKVLEEEVNKIFGTKSLYDEHDCNVVSMNSLNIHDANDMQSYKLGDAMFDEDDMFSPPKLIPYAVPSVLRYVTCPRFDRRYLYT